MAETRVVWRGKRLNTRTVAMLTELEKRLGHQLVLSQGSYNTGGVIASAGTHDGGGAVDIHIDGIATTERKRIVLYARQLGFFASLRNPDQGKWPWHIHMIAAGDPELSRGAAFQIAEYRRGHNGLANRGSDDGPAGYRMMTWELYLKTKAANAAKATGATTPPRDVSISLGAMVYARTHNAMSGVWGFDRAQVFAWAVHPKVAVITRTEFNAYYTGGLTAADFIDLTRRIQHKFGFVVDGNFGPQTAGAMKRSGYKFTA